VLHDALQEALAGDFVDRVETQIGNRTLALTARPLGVGGAPSSSSMKGTP